MGDAHSLIKWDGKSHHVDQIKNETLLILKAHSRMKYSSIFCNMKPNPCRKLYRGNEHGQPVVKFIYHFLA